MSTTPHTRRMTDEMVKEQLASQFPGKRRAAEVLAKLPIEERNAVIAEANMLCNVSNRRYSDAIRTAAQFSPSYTSKAAKSIYAREYTYTFLNKSAGGS